MLSVFVSHASADAAQVQLVRQQLTAMNVDVYLAELDPRPGTSVAEKVQDAIKKSEPIVC